MKKLVGLIFALVGVLAFAQDEVKEENVKTREPMYRKGGTQNGNMGKSGNGTSNRKAWRPPVMVYPIPEHQLVLRQDIRKELNIDEALSRNIAGAILKAFPKDLGDSGDPEGQWKRVLFTQDEAMRKQLEQDQRKRIREIYFQYNGVITTHDYEVAKAIDLLPEQRKQIADIIRKYSKELKTYQDELAKKRDERAKAMSSSKVKGDRKPAEVDGELSVPPPSETPGKPVGPRPREFSGDAKMTELREKANVEINQILSETQRAKFKALGGQPFKFADRATLTSS